MEFVFLMAATFLPFQLQNTNISFRKGHSTGPLLCSLWGGDVSFYPPPHTDCRL